jgi:hypothetical protein
MNWMNDGKQGGCNRGKASVDRLISLFYLVVSIFDRRVGAEKVGTRDARRETGDERRKTGRTGRRGAVDEKDDLTARSMVVMTKGMQKDC